MKALVAVGRVAAPHGVRGRLKVAPLTDDPRRFSSLERLMVQLAGQEPRSMAVEDVAFQPKSVLLKLSGVDSLEAALQLKGASLLIPEELVPPAAPDEYYYYQLEGLRVETESGEPLGTLDYVGKTGGNDVYFIKPRGGGSHLLAPALKRCIRSIDLQRGIMVVDKDWVV